MERSSVIFSDTKVLSFVNWIDDAEPNPDYMTECYQFGHPKKKPKQSITLVIDIDPVFLLLTLNRFLTLFWCFQS